MRTRGWTDGWALAAGEETWEAERRLERRQGVEYIVLGFGEFPRHVQAGPPIRSTDNYRYEVAI
jgi:hypothetical protein